ncbi:MAG TPA: DUF4129 domain-containing protein [Streptosporangiaceae bacterium]|jgi:hypothetical protein
MTSQQHGPAFRGTALRVIPLTLLILLAMAGLRGSVDKPKWTGSHRTDFAFGITLFVVFLVLLVIIMRRRTLAFRAVSDDAVTAGLPWKLRSAIMAILSAALIADVVAMLYGLHLKLPPPRPQPTQPARKGVPPSQKTPHIHSSGGGGSFPIGDILWGLLIAVLIVAIVVTLRWLARQTRVRALAEDDEIAEDSQTLREAVESGRSALRTFDDAKSAIIACYVAMERSLAERGTTRTEAGTPDELLARATQNKVVGGSAPARLTALFYEARFSSHPMDQTQRAAAEQALDELARALASQDREPQETGG